MSRGIEFRGLCADTGNFVYGYYVANDNYHTIAHKSPDDSGMIRIHEVDGETVGQFTGLLDCNGVKMFEGDIVHFELDDFDIYFEVALNSSGCFVARNHLQVNDFYFLDDFDYTVAGNVHQNSELLK